MLEKSHRVVFFCLPCSICFQSSVRRAPSQLSGSLAVVPEESLGRDFHPAAFRDGCGARR